jgi:tetratricopeptide (TPR) repeat protein
MEPSAPRNIHKYEVIDLIGRGGMGVVYKAMDRALNRPVAIKMVTNADDPNGELLQRFYRESQFTASLRHENIVIVYELGDFEGQPYLVMEYLAGQSLESMLARQPMTLPQRINYVRQVCNGLHYAHTRQPSIIHRDIKPANIVVLEDGTAKIVDFGIARLEQSQDTRSGQIMGSYHYMSPEQIKDHDLDGRTDIFSLGIVLYQLLTLTLPFEGSGIAQTLHRIVNSPPPPLSQFLKEYPPALDDVIARALAKNREDRYPTAEEFAFDLLQVEEEFRRGGFDEHIGRAQALVQAGNFDSAKQELLQVLSVDYRHPRANELMREVQAGILRQQRKARARSLRIHAEEAMEKNDLTQALTFLDQATTLDDTDSRLGILRDHVRDLHAHAQKLNELLERAERLLSSHDLDNAARAVNEALEFDPEAPRAKAFKLIVEAKLIERQTKLQVQELLGAARRDIANANFANALVLLRKAESIDPTVSGLRDLVGMAESGARQKERQRILVAATAEIRTALENQNLALAGSLIDKALEKFPEERSLLELRSLVQQRVDARKREYAAPPKRENVEAPTSQTRQPLPVVRHNRTNESSVAELTPLHGMEAPNTTTQSSGRLSPNPPGGGFTDTPLPHLGDLVDASLPMPSVTSRNMPRELSPFPADLLQMLESRLIRHIGPLAKVVVKRAAAKAGDADELCTLLGESITSSKDREAFLAVRSQIPNSTGRQFHAPQPTSSADFTSLGQQEAAGELTPQMLDDAARALARYVGPLAKILTKKAAQRARNLRSLYSILSEHIESESDRARFLKESETRH